MDMFAQASRLGIRFSSAQGNLSVEDLWKLPIAHANGNKASLEAIGLALKDQIEAQKGGGSMFGTTTLTKAQARERKVTQLKFDIVKFVGETLVKEAEQRAKAAETRAANQRIMELIGQKQDKELEGKSIDELRGLLQTQSNNADVEEEDVILGS